MKAQIESAQKKDKPISDDAQHNSSGKPLIGRNTQRQEKKYHGCLEGTHPPGKQGHQGRHISQVGYKGNLKKASRKAQGLGNQTGFPGKECPGKQGKKKNPRQRSGVQEGLFNRGAERPDEKNYFLPVIFFEKGQWQKPGKPPREEQQPEEKGEKKKEEE